MCYVCVAGQFQHAVASAKLFGMLCSRGECQHRWKCRCIRAQARAPLSGALAMSFLWVETRWPGAPLSGVLPWSVIHLLFPPVQTQTWRPFHPKLIPARHRWTHLQRDQILRYDSNFKLSELHQNLDHFELVLRDCFPFTMRWLENVFFQAASMSLAQVLNKSFNWMVLCIWQVCHAAHYQAMEQEKHYSSGVQRWFDHQLEEG